MPRYTIDRFEGDDWVVLEDERARTFSVPRPWLPPEVREGDVIDVSAGGAGDAYGLRVVVDVHGRDDRLSQALRRRSSLPRGPRGDVSL